MNVNQVDQQSTQQAHFQPIQGAFAQQNMSMPTFPQQQQQLNTNPGQQQQQQQLQYPAGVAPNAVSGTAVQMSDDGNFIIPPFDAAMGGQVPAGVPQIVQQQSQQQQQLIQGTQDGAGKNAKLGK